MKVDLICPQCEQPFQAPRSRVRYNERRGKLTFCTLRCVGLRFGPKQRGWNKLTPFTWFLEGIKRRCKRKEWRIEITREQLAALWERQRGKCPYTGWDLVLPESGKGWIFVNRNKCLNPKNPKHASVDRIDSAKGYVEGNIQFVSVLANLAKRSMSEADFVAFCEAVAGHWAKK